MLAGPIRGELLGPDHLAERARDIAHSQRLAPKGRKRRGAPLLERLHETEGILEECRFRLEDAAGRGIDISPAGDWLLDNYHVVREHILEVDQSMPRGYYRELPEVAEGPLAKYPRVYQLAITLIAHTEGRIELANAELFVREFQRVAPLRIGELWAVPAMLRLGLLENVRRMSLRTVERLDELERADRWARRLQAAADLKSGSMRDFIGANPPISPLFLTRLLRLLRHGAISQLVWLEQWLTQGGVDLEAAAARSSERLALTQMVMANSITSLRAIGSMDWREFVERQSELEAMLAADPAGAFTGMRFATRDRYRHVVEHLARKTTRTELDVARLAIDLAFAGAREAPNAVYRAHVGFYLVDDGRLELERATGYRPTATEQARRWLSSHQAVLLSAVAVATVLAVGLLLWLAGSEARRQAFLVILFGLVPAAEIAVNGVNRLVTMVLPPRILPKLELRERPIPLELRTAVVVPTLFDTVEGVRESLEHLEVQYLANRQERLHFALLSDFTDAATETTAGDAEILAAATEGVRELNARYSNGTDDAFYLFHRPRLWNSTQQVWMGWERKRGKLAQFNRFLRDNAGAAFSTIVGNVDAIRQVRYVITLDADTVLPPDAADLLIGTIAHPLNRAIYDRERRQVVRGYGILQPRVGVALSTAHRSRFASIHSGHPGVDPYTTAVSDVYQDLFAEGSFTGKGIYDVDIFEQATEGRFPENALLSHDLIEGSYARAGLATDIELFDDYPTRYLTYTSRKHRWIRGDWQLIQWLLPRVPGPNGKEPNTLSVLSRWKLFDNLRRSTSEVSQLLLFMVGWSLLPGSPWRWTLLGIGAVATPWIMALVPALLHPPLDKSWRAYYDAVRQDAATSAKQLGLALVLLPHQAWVSADAIIRTLWRLFVSKRNLLEWRTASQTERALAPEGRETWRAMGPAVTLAVLLALLMLLPHVGRPGAWQWTLAILPIATLWLASPVVAHALTQPALEREHRLKGDQRPAALRYALPHWRYFDRFVTAETNWLVADNFQEDPLPVVAMRTSPTNIGLQLLATVSAYDLGFITLDGMTTRLEAVFRSLEKMRRFRGHFLNWYELRDLQVLHPGYVSTVDSGNLAGHLLALRQACLTIPDEPAVDNRVWHALEVGLEIAEEQLHALESSRARLAPRHRQAVHDAARAVRAGRRLVTLARKGRHPPALRDIAKQLVTARSGLPSDGGTGLTIARDSILWVVDRIVTHQREWDSAAAVPTLRALATHAPASLDHVARLEAIADRAYEYVMGMDFEFLFNRDRKLLCVGYQEATHTLDNSFYDLLASETRLASFMAIAKKDVPVEHWFRLGRSLTHAAGETALISWTGSMFEYLMPLLVMHSLPETLLDQTYQGVVERQISYCSERGLPWGVSESAYNLRDRAQTYQYRAFGVPDLALKRGLRRELVVAPYASALAIMVEPENALENLDRLARLGALGPYGFRDALDYTRPIPGHAFAIVYTYMAHHIGMTLVALTNALTGHAWQRRFHSDPLVQSAELLLHERIPRRLVLQPAQRVRPEPLPTDVDLERPAVREVETPDTPRPRLALLGHLPYTIMVSNAGSGYSRYESLAITRWHADATTDHTGQFCYVKDVAANRVWSAAHQPVRAPADWYRALLATDRVVFHRRDGDIETHTEIAAVPADAAEVRRVTLTNHSGEPREIELTSYGEIVLAPPDDDRAHRAFGNLFIETEWHAWCTAITATRRPRSSTEARLWCVHLVDSSPEKVGAVSYETDRARFLGRGRGPGHPIALTRDDGLGGTAGAVLDPIFALRIRLRVEPGQTASAAFTTLVAATRERAFELADRYHDPYAAERALELAWTAAQLELRELGITPADAALYQELAGNLFYADPRLRIPADELLENRGGQPLLWSQGISGDWPILLATIDDPAGLPTWRELLAAHQYWRRRGMMIDLVVFFDGADGYFQDLQDDITNAVLSSSEAGVLDRPGGVFVRRLAKISPEERQMLRATARVLVPCDGQPLGRIVGPPDLLIEHDEWEPRTLSVAPPRPARPSRWGSEPAHPVAPPSEPPPASAGSNGFDSAVDQPDPPPNGFGALTDEGTFEIQLTGDALPPAPWSNVVANPDGGFMVSESGAGCTWASNSYFYRLTPWHNDPVTDPISDVLYLRDEETGELWSATPAPIRDRGLYTVRHGAGWSQFEHRRGDIETSLTLGMAEADPVKLAILAVTNAGDRPRRLTLTAYVEWTLGVLREHTQHQVVTRFDPARGAIIARNSFDPAFADHSAFCAISEPVTAHTGDRCEFLGRNGTTANPEALRTEGLSGTTGAGYDPCAALQCPLVLEPGERREIAIVLGAAAPGTEVGTLLDRYRDVGRATEAAARSTSQWRDRLSRITVRTPEPSFDAMVNQWTLYQALSCRMWARSALYQSSGAYGFRDQLQDTMAFVYAEPAIAREHLIRAAGRQFVEGDVQHWWHPNSGRGLRSRCSDDLVWLPYVADHYVRVTGDRAVLDEIVPFITMRPLEPHEHEIYERPEPAGEAASLYEHCLRAIRKGCTTGSHGLPLIGSCDWNDGMNRVGIEGKGESVWLAWFLVATLRTFAEHAAARGDPATAADLRRHADGYADAADTYGWDGAWYRRAYFDDGTPIGSAQNDECRIDAIAQSWSVISGGGRPARARQAMESLDRELVRERDRMVLLLTPPFDRSDHDPGYIKGYVPGVRENGAQYTHAAAWVALARAMLGHGDRAFELYQMLNPLTHSRTPAEVAVYQTEPYAIAADVYTVEGRVGRGGWTWYTGSASWMYRVALEAIIGLRKTGDTLALSPCIPRHWPKFEVRYRHGSSQYRITVTNPDRVSHGATAVTVDGVLIDGPHIPLADDGKSHDVSVVLHPDSSSITLSLTRVPGAGQLAE